MSWKIVETDDPLDLTDAELIGLSILAAQYMGEPADDLNVYYRAWKKIQPMVNTAIDREET